MVAVTPRLWGAFGLLLLLALSSGCASMSGLRGAELNRISEGTRCRVGASQTSLLVTEWSAPEKSNLEALMGGSAVAVEFTGCSLRLLPQCRLKGSYAWQRTTPSTEGVDIQDQAELYSKLPLGAVELAGELERAGSLRIETTVSGHLRLRDMTASEVTSVAECARATHLVEGLSLGAFTLSGSDSSRAKGGAGAYGLGLGGQSQSSQRVMKQAGDKQACANATEEGSPFGCSSPVQVYLAPIPGRAEVEGPPGALKVDFISAKPSVRWDVYINDQATCTTPCVAWVDPSRPVELRTREDRPDKLGVQRLETGQGPLQVQAKPSSQGQFVTGLTFTALGGMAVITGTALAGLGCSLDDHRGMCTAGLITLPIGAVVTAGSIFLMLDSGPEAQVVPIFGANSFGFQGRF
jgi:hypothetical protein